MEMKYTYTPERRPCQVLDEQYETITQYTDGVRNNCEAIFDMGTRLVALLDVGEQRGGTATVASQCETLAELSLLAAYRSGVVEDLMATVVPKFGEVAEIPASLEECCSLVAEKSSIILALGKTVAELAAEIIDSFVTTADACASLLHCAVEQMPDHDALESRLKTVADCSATIRERHKMMEGHAADISVLCREVDDGGEVN